MNQTDLKSVVDGIRARLIKCEAGRVGVDAKLLNLIRRRAEWRAVGRAQDVEIRSLCAIVGQIQNPIGRERGFRAEVPDLSVAILIEGIDGLRIRNEGAGLRNG